MLRHLLRLFIAVVSPTICYASGTWTPTKEHERMIQSTQRKMLRLIVQTKRRYKKIGKRKDETNENDDTEDLGRTGDQNEDGQSSTTHSDQDSDISFENDTDDEIDTTTTQEEEWIEYIKRSTDEAIGKMENAKIRCWIKTHKRMKWRLALRKQHHRLTPTNSSNSKRMRQNTPLKITTNTTSHGSKQQKTVEDGLYLKTTTK